MTRGVGHDWFCDVGFVDPGGTSAAPGHGRVLVAMEALVWSTAGHLLAQGNVRQSFALDVVEIDPAAGARVVRRTPGAWSLAAGPGGSFAYLVPGSRDDRSTLEVVGGHGDVAVRQTVPVWVFGSPAIHLT